MAFYFTSFLCKLKVAGKLEREISFELLELTVITVVSTKRFISLLLCKTAPSFSLFSSFILDEIIILLSKTKLFVFIVYTHKRREANYLVIICV